MDLESLRRDQALLILEHLERVPGLCAKRGPDGKWLAWLPGKAPHYGETLTDALGQLTTVLAIEGADA